jgi:hypothetical protein
VCEEAVERRIDLAGADEVLVEELARAAMTPRLEALGEKERPRGGPKP